MCVTVRGKLLPEAGGERMQDGSHTWPKKYMPNAQNAAAMTVPKTANIVMVLPPAVRTGIAMELCSEHLMFLKKCTLSRL
jgi:hypothetical protein